MPHDLSQNEQTLQIGSGHNVLPKNAYVRELLRIITKMFHIVMCTISITVIIPVYHRYSIFNFTIIIYHSSF